MTHDLAKLLIGAPGVLALLWVLAEATVLRWRRAKAAARTWPALGSGLGLDAFLPEQRTRTWPYAGLRGAYAGREVRLETGVSSSGPQGSTSGYTSWRTAAAGIAVRIHDRKLLDRMLPGEGLRTGDAEFDRGFSVEGDPAEAARLLTPAAREAISAYARALGGFSLGAEGLQHTLDAVIPDGALLAGVLEWQRWVLDGLGREQVPPSPPVLPAPRRASAGAAALALLVMFGSMGGVILYQQVVVAGAAPPGAPEAQVGARVLADFQGQGERYAGVVVGVTPGDALEVVYLDGMREAASRAGLALDRLRPGARVRTLRGDARVEARLSRRVGTAVEVRFDDGTTAWRALGQLAIPASELPRDGEPYVDGGEGQVLATWQDDRGWLYPGTVVGRDGARCLVVFEDGSSDWRAEGQVRPDALRGGGALEVREGEVWRGGRVLYRLGPALQVQLEDGRELWTALSRVRVRAQ